MKYRQLTLTKRYHISTLIKEGLNQKDIAKEIGVHPSTICREFKRFKDTNNQEYHPETLQVEAKIKHIQKSKRSAMTKPIEKYIRKKLKEDWSPEQLIGRMKLDINRTISHETIYQFIYANKAGIAHQSKQTENGKSP